MLPPPGLLMRSGLAQVGVVPLGVDAGIAGGPAQPYRLADLQTLRVGQGLDHQLGAAAGIQGAALALAEEQGLADLGADLVPAGWRGRGGGLFGCQQLQLLGAQHEQQFLVGSDIRCRPHRQSLTFEVAMRLGPRGDAQEVGIAEKGGDEGVGRILVEVIAAAQTDDATVAEDGDALGQPQRLFLVMGDVDDGDAQAPVQLAQFVLQVFAQLLVQGAQGFVHQQDAWLVH